MHISFFLLAGLLIVSVLLAARPVDAVLSSGIIGQTITNDSMSLQVSGISIANNSGQKEVSLTIVFKNLDFKPQLFNVFNMKLKDTDGREYSPDIFKSTSTGVAVPTQDTISSSIVFAMPSSFAPQGFRYTDFLKTPLSVDLSKSKSPADPLPTSGWVLSGNKGFVARDSKMELSVNDESYTDQYYAVDITIRNIGKDTVNYNPFYAYIKDQSGKASSYAIFSDGPAALSSGALAPGELVRGTISFETDTSKPVMFIWSEFGGLGAYLNTGTLKTVETPASPSPSPKGAPSLQEQQEYTAKLVLSASLTEKTKSLSMSIKNPRNSDAKIYELHISLPDNAQVKFASKPLGWNREIGDDTVTFSTESKPLLVNKSMKFTLKLDKTVKSLDWDAYDEDGNIINSKTAKVTERK